MCQRSNFIFKIDKIFNYIIIKVHSYTTLKMLYLSELIIVKQIYDKDQPDEVIILGDYFDSFNIDVYTQGNLMRT